jgi:hypothetical protein
MWLMLGFHSTTIISSLQLTPQLAHNHRPQGFTVPLPSYEGCGPVLDGQYAEGGRNWEVVGTFSPSSLPSRNSLSNPYPPTILRQRPHPLMIQRSTTTIKATHTTTKGNTCRGRAAHVVVGNPMPDYDTPRRLREANTEVGPPTSLWVAQLRGATPHVDSGGPNTNTRGQTTHAAHPKTEVNDTTKTQVHEHRRTAAHNDMGSPTVEERDTTRSAKAGR